MPASEWNRLRPWNGSQQEAFEELCCQLAARRRDVPAGARFTRKAAPDAGIECYWVLPSGDEWGLQAKFFTGSMGTSQWKQLDDSVRTALVKHPKLTRYTVCLPRNREDPRAVDPRTGRSLGSLKSEWDRHVKTWQGWARESNSRRGPANPPRRAQRKRTRTSRRKPRRAVTFEYWGDTEIFLELTRDDHSGRRTYWFDEPTFSPDWFQRHLSIAARNAGPRYTPEFNLELPLAFAFEGLGRTPKFRRSLDEHFGKVAAAARDVRPPKAAAEWTPHFQAVQAAIDAVLALRRDPPPAGASTPSWFDPEAVADAAASAAGVASDCADRLRETDRKNGTASPVSTAPAGDTLTRASYESELAALTKVARELYSLNHFCGGPAALAAAKRRLLLIGPAGSGKTHLLCDVAARRIAKGLPTVLVLGEQMEDSDPWTQIFRLLQLPFNDADTFLGALDAAGEAAGHPALLMVDALNEGAGRSLWRKHLPGFLASLERFENIAFAASVRSPYDNYIVPLGPLRDQFVVAYHHGFAEVGYKAIRRYFGGYGIELPSVPLLDPEFHNPLFLKTFCQGLRNRQMSRVPEGVDGVTAVFDFYVASLAEKVLGPHHVIIDPSGRLLHRLAVALAEEMAKRSVRHLSQQDVESVVARAPSPSGWVLCALTGDRRAACARPKIRRGRGGAGRRSPIHLRPVRGPLHCPSSSGCLRSVSTAWRGRRTRRARKVLTRRRGGTQTSGRFPATVPPPRKPGSTPDFR